MLLTVSIQHSPASDIGYLWHKNPARAQSFALSFGQARVWYPRIDEANCCFALWLEVDPVRLSRGERGREWGLEPYVNDRPYVASSFLCVALSQVLREAMNGQSKERPALAQTPLPLNIHLPVVPSHGGRELLERLFAPLGYQVEATPLGEEISDARYFALTLRATKTLGEALTHLYVLLPVTDNGKHYWIGDDEVEKLLRRGGAWLARHPEREMIAFRYLNRRRALANEAVARLMSLDDAPPIETANEDETAPIVEAKVPEAVSLHTQRLSSALHELKASGARSVLDLGCGEGRLLQLLLKETQFARICGLDVSHRALEIATRRLKLERLSETQRARLELWHGALTYRDARWNGFDAAAVVEVIEHLDTARLDAFERALWGSARPKTVVLTTPNREYNALWPTLPAGEMRHRDHRFEWTRAEFETWAQTVCGALELQRAFRAGRPIRRNARRAFANGGLDARSLRFEAGLSRAASCKYLQRRFLKNPLWFKSR